MAQIKLKRFFLLAGMLLGGTLAARAQNAQPTSAFGMRLSGVKSQQTVALGDGKNQVLRVLGPPTKTSRFYAEIDEQWLPVLHYGGNKLFFLHNRLVLVEISDPRLTVGQAGTPGFRVGSALPKAKPGTKPTLAFGRFSVEHKPGSSHGFAYSAVSYGNMKTDQGKVLDVIYEIQYDRQGRVSSIFLDETYD